MLDDMNDSAKEKIILAVDAADADSAARLLDPLAGHLRWAKIGLQLFTAEGPRIVRVVRERGLRIFLDLKFHDIPNTVREAVHSAVQLGVEMTTIHLAGGPRMVEAAVAAAGNDTLVLGVTVLTSMDGEQLRATGISVEPREQVLSLAKMGASVGLRGVVASPQEICALRSELGDDMTIVTPGIRPAGADVGDQSRIATPAQAVNDGASFLVIGRPISAASDPLAAFLAIAEEIEN